MPIQLSSFFKFLFKFYSKPISESKLILLVSLFVLATHNIGFFQNTVQVYQTHDNLSLSLLLVSVLHGSLLFLAFSLLGFGWLLRILLAATLVISASAAYFTDTYNVIIDVDMIDNSLKTDPEEVRDLLSIQQGMYILFLGLVPAWLVLTIPLTQSTWAKRIAWRLGSFTIVMAVMVGTLVTAADFYATYIRENATLRYYSTPLAPLYEVGLYVDQEFIGQNQAPFQIIAPQATRTTGSKPKLSVMIVGETLRADHVGLNGYERDTTPLLAQEQVVSYSNVSSCGTSTAFSLPCMFSVQQRSNYSKQQAGNMENALDILQKTGVNVVWIDNNSSSKGVADRVDYREAKSSQYNTICNPECRDVGMLPIASTWLQDLPAKQDKLVVLHQMGSHGPAYYKRYPKQFEKFTDVCESNQLDSCSRQQIINTYDNTVLYTDYFLAQTIHWLEQQQANYDVSMLYISDHGESLGEGGLYLHGYPYMFAPKEQTHVPMIAWVADNHSLISYEELSKKKDQELSHDELFHTLLGMYGVEAEVYEAGMDLFE